MTTFISRIMSALRSAGRVYGRELRIIFSDMGALIFLVGLPLAYPVVYSLIYNPELVREVPVVVVDSDRTSGSREFVRNLNATQGADVIGYAASLPEARRAMDSKDAFAILEIPSGFDRKIGRGEQAPVVLYCEMSLLLRYRALLFSMTPLQQATGAKLLAQDIDGIGAESLMATPDPMPIESVALGNLQSGFDSFIMPGVLILILQQSIMLGVGMIGGGKREPASRIGYNPLNEIRFTLPGILIKTCAYLTVIALPMIWLVHYIPILFQFPMAGSTLEIFCFLLPMFLASVFLGQCVQAFTTERESIFIIWVATTILFLFLSGLTWPRYAMSAGWKVISDLIPATWGINGFILINGNGSTLSQVSEQWHNLWILAAFYLVIAWAVQKFIVKRHLYPQSVPAENQD